MFQCAYQMWRQLIQLARMVASKPSKKQFPFARKPQDRPTFVGYVLGSRKHTFALRPVHKFYCAVMLQSKPLGSIGNRHHCSLRSPGYLQEKLVLFRL